MLRYLIFLAFLLKYVESRNVSGSDLEWAKVSSHTAGSFTLQVVGVTLPESYFSKQPRSAVLLLSPELLEVFSKSPGLSLCLQVFSPHFPLTVSKFEALL